MAVNSINTTTASTASTTSTTSGSNTLDEAQTRFMTLLVTQMQNQDPLNPMDNQDLTAQIAQLNTVSGINKLNTSVESLLSNLQASQSMQAANLIGRTVVVESPNIELKNGSAAVVVDLAKDVDALQVEVVNQAGETVRTLNAGASTAGWQEVNWDGKTDTGLTAADGTYTLKVNASYHGSAVTASTLAMGKVDGVSMGNSGVKLISSTLGEVAFSDLRQVN